MTHEASRPNSQPRQPSESPRNIRIAYLEDDLDDVYLVRSALAQDTNRVYQLTHAATFLQLHQYIANIAFDILFLDLSVGRENGLGTLKQTQDLLRLNNANIPIVILTGLCDDAFGERAIQLGAADYLPKQYISAFALSQCIRFAIERHGLTCKLIHQARYDELTGLYNRAQTLRACEAQANNVTRSPFPLAFVILDLNDFKCINDQHGHFAGDRILRVFGTRLINGTRTTDTVGRLGGDEFLVLLTHFDSGMILEETLVTLKACLEAPTHLSLQDKIINIPIRTSVGAAIFTGDHTVEQTLAFADQAMYASKHIHHGRPVISSLQRRELPTIDDQCLNHL